MHRFGWLLATLLVPALARADDNVERANSLFDEAKALEKSGRTEEACAKFDQSYRLAPRSGTLLNLGLCHEKMGALLAARRELRDALALAQRDGRADRIPLATSHLQTVEGRLAWISVDAPLAEEVRVDHAPIARAEWTNVPVEAGTHEIMATAIGRSPKAITVTLGEGNRTKVSITLEASAVSRGALIGGGAPTPTRKSSPWKWIVLGTGAESIAASLALGAWALERKGFVGDHCDAAKTCDPDGLDATGTGRALTIASTVLGAVGVVGVGASFFIPATTASGKPAGLGFVIGGSF
ncbi:hypothetical protein BH09MYX1_BH09MYX1_01810 [soil metagenome]